MALRGIYSIDVDDSAFKNFHATFEKYQRAVMRLPAAWREVSAEAVKGKNAFADMAAAMMAQAELLHRAQQDSAGLSRNVTSAGRGMAGLARHTKEVAASLLSATRTLVRWTGITTAATGLVGGGSLWGIERLAMHAGDIRRSALGLGISPAEQQASVAFRHVLGQDPRAFMGQLLQYLETAEGKTALLGAGVDQNMWGRNSAQLLYPFLSGVQNLAKGAPPGLLGNVLQSRGLGNVPLDLAETLRGMSRKELAEWNALFEQQTSALREFNSRNLLTWAKFDLTLDLAWQKIEDVFINRTRDLAGPMSKLSEAATNVVVSFLQGPGFAKLIGDVSGALDRFANYVGTEKFASDVESFVVGVGNLAKAVGSAVSRLTKMFEGDTGDWSPRSEAGEPLTKKSDIVGLLGMGAGFWLGARFGLPGAVVGTLAGAAVTGAGTDTIPIKPDGTIDRNEVLSPRQLYRDMPGLSPNFQPSLPTITQTWDKLRDWLLGTGGTVPRVKLDVHPGDAQYEGLYKALGLGPGGAGAVPGGFGAGPGGVDAGDLAPRSGPVSEGELARYKQYYDYLVNNKHLTPEQATGMIAGGIRPESHGNPGAFNPNDAGTGPSGGLFQHHADRFARMSSAVRDWRTNWQGQLDYSIEEMKSRDPGYFDPGGTAESKAAEWTRVFEKPRNKAAQAAVRASGASSLLGRLRGAFSGLFGAGDAHAASAGFDIAVGDSIAAGLAGVGGFSERTSRAARDRARYEIPAVWGRSPQQVLDTIRREASGLRGRHVLLSSGASNDPSQTSLVAEQLELLKKAGADVALLGVGTGVRDYKTVNEQLRKAASEARVPFTGVLAGTEGGRVHPRDYMSVLQQAQKVTVVQPSGIKVTVHQDTGGQAPVIANQVRH